MLTAVKRFLIECKDCIITGGVLVGSVISDNQIKTSRTVIIHVSFFAFGYWVATYFLLDMLATMFLSFTFGRYSNQLDKHLSSLVSALPDITSSAFKEWRNKK